MLVMNYKLPITSYGLLREEFIKAADGFGEVLAAETEAEVVAGVIVH